MADGVKIDQATFERSAKAILTALGTRRFGKTNAEVIIAYGIQERLRADAALIKLSRAERSRVDHRQLADELNEDNERLRGERAALQAKLDQIRELAEMQKALFEGQIQGTLIEGLFKVLDSHTIAPGGGLLDTQPQPELSYDDLTVEVIPAPDQKVNENDRGIRITHKPTGIVAESTKERSQLANRAAALDKLRIKLTEAEIHE